MKLKTTDIKLLDDIFEMQGGYVLDFSNQTFSDFFEDEFGIDINNDRYLERGTSKAKILRFYLRQEPAESVVKILLALWEYKESIILRNKLDQIDGGIKEEFFSLIKRLGGKPPQTSRPKPAQEIKAIDASLSANLLNELTALSSLEPHPRGYAFEKYLKSLFDVNSLEGRASFRLVGEQIDGSFELSGETYLLEAKWTNQPIGSADLRSFNAKVEDKAAWSRGLFISNSGFSEDGLTAFGKGKSIICMDGVDMSEMLMDNRSFAEVVSRKVRRAAETGDPFVRVRDLYSGNR
jgi:hypothetical protein